MLDVKLGLQPNIVSMSETTLGKSSQNEGQTLFLKGTGGNFRLTSPFERAPHNVVATADTGGTLTAAAYYYVVTSMIGSVESAQSQEVSATVGDSGKIDLSWDDLAAATGRYRVYRGSSAASEDHYDSIAPRTHALTDHGSSLFTTPAAPPPAVSDENTP